LPLINEVTAGFYSRELKPEAAELISLYTRIKAKMALQE